MDIIGPLALGFSSVALIMALVSLIDVMNLQRQRWKHRKNNASSVSSSTPSMTTFGQAAASILSWADDSALVRGDFSHVSSDEAELKDIRNLMRGDDPAINRVVLLLLQTNEVLTPTNFEELSVEERANLLIEANDLLETPERARAWYQKALERTL